MPINLDSCITGIFVPGNIGASSGLPPVVRVVPSLDGEAPAVSELTSASDTLDAFFGELLHEAASAADSYSSTGGTYDVSVVEAAAASDAPLVHEPGDILTGVTETAAAADVVDWVATTSAEVAAFLARTSGLDTAHVDAYTALIDGLVADGVWSKLDVLRIYATQDSTTALLNLISSSYSGITHSSPAFTADRGFTGGYPAYIESQFIPSSAPSPKFVRDSCHISTWNLTNSTSTGIAIGNNTAGTGVSNIHPKYTDGNAYFRINGAFNTAGAAMTDARGHFIANRSGGSAVQGYKNGTSVLTNTDSSVTVSTIQFYDLTVNSSTGGPVDYISFQIAATSIGSSLSGTDATNFYNRLRTYMTAMGIP